MTNSCVRRLFTAVVIVMYILYSTNAVDTNCTDDQRLNGPVIIPCQSELILRKGQNYTLTCKGKTKVQFKQQEIPEEVIGPFTKIQKINTYNDSDEYKFETTLELYNIDQFAIGYYACFDDTVNGTEILNNLIEEPTNTENISFIYIYVNGSDSLFAPMRAVIVPRKKCKLVIECRPTTPDIEVNLLADFAEPIYQQYSPKIGFVIDSDMLSEPLGSNMIYRICEFQGRNIQHETEVFFQRR